MLTFPPKRTAYICASVPSRGSYCSTDSDTTALKKARPTGTSGSLRASSPLTRTLATHAEVTLPYRTTATGLRSGTSKFVPSVTKPISTIRSMEGLTLTAYPHSANSNLRISMERLRRGKSKTSGRSHSVAIRSATSPKTTSKNTAMKCLLTVRHTEVGFFPA